MSNRIGGFVPVEKRAFVEAVISRRNRYVMQAEGLQARVDKLYAKITALDEEIAAACDPF